MTDSTIDLVFSGSGTLFPCHIGAYTAIRKQGFVVKRVAGTSGGAVVAAAIAHGMSPEDMLSISKKLLNKKILDRQWFPWRDYGLHRADKIHKAISEILPGKMGDVAIPFGVFTVDLETGRVVFISRSEKKVPVADAVTASMSIPFFFRAREIRGMKGYHVDGGVSANFAMGVWDDIPTRRTIGVRFRFNPNPPRKPVKSIVDFTRATMGALVDNANRTHVSRKRWQNVIQIETDGDGMNFDLSSSDVQKLYNDGYESALRYLRRGIQ